MLPVSEFSREFSIGVGTVTGKFWFRKKYRNWYRKQIWVPSHSAAVDVFIVGKERYGGRWGIGCLVALGVITSSPSIRPGRMMAGGGFPRNSPHPHLHTPQQHIHLSENRFLSHLMEDGTMAAWRQYRVGWVGSSFHKMWLQLQS